MTVAWFPAVKNRRWTFGRIFVIAFVIAWLARTYAPLKIGGQEVYFLWINIFTLMLLIGLYLLPLVLASLRRCDRTVSIGVLNVLLGWTGVVWLLCLVWAIFGIRRDRIYLI